MEPTSEPVEWADAPAASSSFEVRIPATGSRIRIRRLGVASQGQGTR
ncbi:hypothetical protein [Agrococcus sp. SGAir0287]|nr:hypothetical protein [Agrococcus sp. SGAir0287]